MFNPEILDLSARSIKKFGTGVQTMKAIEEMAECLDAIAKASRIDLSVKENEEAYMRLAEEVADLYIVTHHLINIMGPIYMAKCVDRKLWKFKKSLHTGKKPTEN